MDKIDLLLEVVKFIERMTNIAFIYLSCLHKYQFYVPNMSNTYNLTIEVIEI